MKNEHIGIASGMVEHGSKRESGDFIPGLELNRPRQPIRPVNQHKDDSDSLMQRARRATMAIFNFNGGTETLDPSTLKAIRTAKNTADIERALRDQERSGLQTGPF